MESLGVNLLSIASMLMAAAALYKALRMSSHEAASTDANAVRSFAEAARLASQHANELSSDVARLEARLDVIQVELDGQRTNNVRYLKILVNWAYGITALLKQLEGNRLNPAWFPDPSDIEEFLTKNHKK